MRPKMILAAAAAVSLLASGPAAAAQSAHALSVAGSPAIERAGAPMEDMSDLRGRRGILGWILGAAAIALLIFVVTESSKNNDLPGSP